MTRYLQIVVCAAGPAADVTQLIAAATKQSWTTAVTATPSALDFIGPEAIERLTGHPVRSTYRSSPGTRRSLPTADALIIAPATYNSVNKIALGIADNYALTTIAELIGRQVPTVVVPFVNTALATRAPFQRAVASLRDERVRIIGTEDGWEPHPPGSGNSRQRDFPWTAALEAATRLADDMPASNTHRG
ncbi:flavoprotein [Micromonospora sp. ATCC 39149]|uniref:Flavoprotein n=1 Tax=Micromonospora carbonacea TaxID=47853 RepID=A0A7D5Y909_9ACTN|nr:flavoprotein [Micromonospora sp. ATCC 39149]EEP73558.1 flavoprotein [Micromonospora sp. ATCC 39149]QLJ99481.1 flavoprotein [Micromonospora carbonacea]